MAYETLINSTVILPVNKPNYTPASSLKKALKALRKLFLKTPQKHQQLLNESMLETPFDATNEQLDDALSYASDEECENYANERLEAGSN